MGYCEPDGNINDGNIRLGGNLISPVYIEKVESIPNDQYLLFQSSNSKERPYINMPYYSNNGDNNSYTPSVGLSFPINTITDFQYRINAGADFDDHVYPYLQTAGPDTQYVDTEFYGNRFINPILCLRWLKLDAIHLVSNNTPIVDHIKSVRFNYNQNNSNDNQRLLPMSLNFEYANPGFLSTPQPSDCSYTFQYYGNISDVKKYLNTNVNGWGFDYGNTDGILKSIKYPTGGKSVFAYNTNYASNVNPKIQYDGSAGSGGGLKVTSIKDFRGGNNDEFVEKKYYYYSGYFTAVPVYTYTWTVPNVADNGGTNITFTKKSITPIIPLSNSFGRDVEYPHIEEIVYKNGEEEMTTDYYYTSYDHISDLDLGGLEDPSHILTDRGFARGRLYKKEVVTSSCKEITEYIYRNDCFSSNNIVIASNYCYYGKWVKYQVYDGINFYDDYMPVGVPFGCRYGLYYSDYDIVEERKTIENFASDVVSEINKKYYKSDYEESIFYDYPDDQTPSSVNIRLLNAEEVIDSEGRSRRTEYHYPYSQSSYNFTTSSTVYENLIKKDFLLRPLAKTNYIDQFLVSKEEWKYDIFDDKILISEWYKSDRNGVFSLPEIKYLKYDNYGNLLSYSNKLGVHNSIIWDKMVMKPSVIINNLSYSSLINRIGQDGIDVFARRFTKNNFRDECLSSLQKIGKQVQVEFYDYLSTGNIFKKILPNGVGYEYQYDNAGRLSLIKTLDGLILNTYDYKYRQNPFSDYLLNY